MFAQDFELAGAEHSVHFPRRGNDGLPVQELLDRRFIILELHGTTIGDKQDLIGAIELGLGSPYLGPDPDPRSPNWAAFYDAFWEAEWLNVRGMVVVVCDGRDLWHRLYEHCGTLIEVWSDIAVAQSANHGRAAHLVFLDGDFPVNSDAPPGGEHLRLFRGVEAVRWMPEGAILAE